MPIPEETIQQILGSTDIVELVESYFPLQKKGQDYWACCPFHSENPHHSRSAQRGRVIIVLDVMQKEMLSVLSWNMKVLTFLQQSDD